MKYEDFYGEVIYTLETTLGMTTSDAQGMSMPHEDKKGLLCLI